MIFFLYKRLKMLGKKSVCEAICVLVNVEIKEIQCTSLISHVTMVFLTSSSLL